jgi:hypothetical protein
LAYKYLFHLLVWRWSYKLFCILLRIFYCMWISSFLGRSVIKYIVVVCTILYGVSYLFPFLIKIFEIWKNEESLTSDKIYYQIYRVISVGSTLILTYHLCVDFPDQYFIYISHFNQDLKRALLVYPEDGGRTFLWNNGNSLPDYTMSHPRWQQSMLLNKIFLGCLSQNFHNPQLPIFFCNTQ